MTAGSTVFRKLRRGIGKQLVGTLITGTRATFVDGAYHDKLMMVLRLD